ncbi:MAG: hypothetical protein A2X74_09145 [Polynucleobacter sp. GWA2_45_21]|nr:MAG: hypothetical protein A2X74_09145 [Polynucleobacter sp. GWA2_45_21]HBK43204.1 hypothetical protein [Polynucleobacter sp.]
MPRVLPKFELEIMFLMDANRGPNYINFWANLPHIPFLLLTDKLTKVQNPQFLGLRNTLLMPKFT